MLDGQLMRSNKICLCHPITDEHTKKLSNKNGSVRLSYLLKKII